MAQQHHEIEDVVVLGANDGDVVHHADEKDFKNMRLAIGTLNKTIFQISLSDDLTAGTRNIDIRLKRRGQEPRPTKAAKVAGGHAEEPPEELHATPPPPDQARLRITVAAEEDAANAKSNKDQDEKRGWFLTVATLFVNMAFDAMLHPPDWMKEEWYEKGWFRTRHAAAAAAAPSPHPTASASQVFRAYFYLTCNSLTFAVALALVLMLLNRWQPSSRFGALITYITMEFMVQLVSFFLALTFALGASNNWKVTGIACVCLLVYTYAALSLIVRAKILDRKSKTNAKHPEKKMLQAESP